KERAQGLANSLTTCIRSNGVIKVPQQKILQEQIRNMHNPNMAEFYEGLVTEERVLKRSRNSLRGASSSHSQPSPSSEETNLEEEVHGVGAGQRGGRGRGSRSGRSDGPNTRGGGSANKRGRGGRRA
ncbi:hypothetical protein MKX03_032087, partial [Papaver bracteatum]